LQKNTAKGIAITTPINMGGGREKFLDVDHDPMHVERREARRCLSWGE